MRRVAQVNTNSYAHKSRSFYLSCFLCPPAVSQPLVTLIFLLPPQLRELLEANKPVRDAEYSAAEVSAPGVDSASFVSAMPVNNNLTLRILRHYYPRLTFAFTSLARHFADQFPGFSHGRCGMLPA